MRLMQRPRGAPVLAMLMMWGAAAFGVAAVAGDVRLEAQIGGDNQKTRFVAFLAQKVDYRVFSIIDPYRIVIDLQQTDIQVPGDKARGLVIASRAGVLTTGKSRIVIDLAEPALVEKSEILPPQNGLPARLVVELTKTNHKAFLAATRAAPPAAETKEAVVEQKDPSDKRPLIIVDPGHGGVDAGAHGRASGLPEKEVTYDFAKTLAAKLESSGRYRVVMTRTTDEFIALDDRALAASKPKADLLISIHADTLDAKKLGVKSLNEVRGATVYTLSEEASDEQSKILAQNENKADVQAGLSEKAPQPISPEISSILSDLESRGKKNRSQSFANYLIEHLKDKMKFNIRPHRSANLRVLKAVGVPAVLFELGYLSNDDDEKLLTSSEWRASTAAAMADVVNAFMAERQAHIPL